MKRHEMTESVTGTLACVVGLATVGVTMGRSVGPSGSSQQTPYPTRKHAQDLPACLDKNNPRISQSQVPDTCEGKTGAALRR